MTVDLSAARGRLSRIVEECPPDALPDLLGELARAQALAQVRLQPPTTNGPRPPEVGEYLTADELAAKLRVRPKWCYEHADDLGAVRLSTGCVRFPVRAVMRLIQARKA